MRQFTIDETTAQKLLEGIDIPPAPQILQTITEEKQKFYPDIKKISTLIAKDVALSAAMLRAANSPAFAIKQKITSIHSAVLNLGLDSALSLVTGLSLRAAVSGNSKVNLEKFWDGAADTAIICSILAKRLHVMGHDVAYNLALFHDVGIPLMMQKFPEYTASFVKKNSKNPQESITALEDKQFKTNHSVLGLMVSRSWGLPDNIRAAILMHHNAEVFQQADSPAAQALARQVGLLTLAEYLCHTLHKEGGDHMWLGFGNKIMGLFGLEEENIKELVDEMTDVLGRL